MGSNRNENESGHESFDNYVAKTLSTNQDFAYPLAIGVLVALMFLLFRPWITLLKKAANHVRGKTTTYEQVPVKNCSTGCSNMLLHLSMGDDDNIVLEQNPSIPSHQINLIDAEKEKDSRNSAYSCLGSFIEALLFDIENLDENRALGVSKSIQSLCTDRYVRCNAPTFQTSILQINPRSMRRRVQLGAKNIFSLDETTSTMNSIDKEEECLADDSVIYLNYRWDDLPDDAKLAAEMIGYNEQLWDNDEESPVMQKKWEELTTVQHAACEELGFKKIIWDNGPFDETEAPDYNSFRWKDLPEIALIAARSLGFNQKMWDADQAPSTFKDLRWPQLTEGQRDACKILGVDKEKWEGGYSSDGDVSEEDIPKPQWQELPERAIKAATLVGYNQKMWDRDESPQICEKRWKELSRQEKRACTILGFRKETWDDEASEVEEPEVKGVTWDKLSTEAKAAAKALGYKKRIWNTGDVPSSRKREWSELTPKQQAAAFYLGYDERKWPIGEDSETGPGAITCGWKWSAPGKLDGQNLFDGTSSRPLGPLATAWQLTSRLFYKDQEQNIEGYHGLSRLFVLDDDTRKILNLSFPTTLINTLPAILDASMIALLLHYLGAKQYLAWAISSFSLGLCDLIVVGVVEAEQVFTAQAIHLKNCYLASQCTQLSSFLVAAASIISYGLLICFLDQILLSVFDFGQTVAVSTKLYIPFVAAARLVERCFAEGVVRLMRNDGHAHTMDKLYVLIRVFHLGMVVLLFVCFKSNSLLQLGVVELVSSFMYVFAVYSCCEYMDSLDKYKRGMFEHFALDNKILLHTILTMAGPLTIGQVLAQGEWRILTFFAASMGPAETAAWKIAETLWNILEAIPSGLNTTAAIFLGNCMKNGRSGTARLLAYKILVVSLIMSVFISTVVFFSREPILHLLIPDTTLYEMVNEQLLPLCCLGSVIMAVGYNGAVTILEAQRRAELAAMISFLGLDLVTVPMAAILVVGHGYGLESLIFSCVVGYSVIGFALLTVVFLSNWPKLSRLMIIKSSKENYEMDALIDATSLLSKYKPPPSVLKKTSRIRRSKADTTTTTTTTNYPYQ